MAVAVVPTKKWPVMMGLTVFTVKQASLLIIRCSSVWVLRSFIHVACSGVADFLP